MQVGRVRNCKALWMIISSSPNRLFLCTRYKYKKTFWSRINTEPFLFCFCCSMCVEMLVLCQSVMSTGGQSGTEALETLHVNVCNIFYQVCLSEKFLSPPGAVVWRLNHGNWTWQQSRLDFNFLFQWEAPVCSSSHIRCICSLKNSSVPFKHVSHVIWTRGS